jgi:hypothetical protein
MGGTGGISTGLPSKNEWAMDESEEWMWYNRQATEVLGASTLEKGRRMDESWMEEADIKQKNGRGNTRKTNTLENETKQQDQMHTWPAEHPEQRKNH